MHLKGMLLSDGGQRMEVLAYWSGFEGVMESHKDVHTFVNNTSYILKRTAPNNSHKLDGWSHKNWSSRFKRPKFEVKVSVGLCSVTQEEEPHVCFSLWGCPQPWWSSFACVFSLNGMLVIGIGLTLVRRDLVLTWLHLQRPRSTGV